MTSERGRIVFVCIRSKITSQKSFHAHQPHIYSQVFNRFNRIYLKLFVYMAAFPTGAPGPRLLPQPLGDLKNCSCYFDWTHCCLLTGLHKVSAYDRVSLRHTHSAADSIKRQFIRFPWCVLCSPVCGLAVLSCVSRLGRRIRIKK